MKTKRDTGIVLKRLRTKRGWTRAQLARRAGLAPSDIAVIESGKCNAPTVPTMKALARALGIISLPGGAIQLSRGDERNPIAKVPFLVEEIRTLGCRLQERDHQTVEALIAETARDTRPQNGDAEGRMR